MLDVICQKTLDHLTDYPGQWAVCGGWAIDLFIGRKSRDHKDLDITIPRDEQLQMQDFLLQRGWQLQQAHKGTLSPWKQGNFLELPRHTIWCNHPDFPPNYLEILFSEIGETHYKFRRNQQIQMPLDRTFLSVRNTQILAPEIVLLFKAKSSAEKPSYQQDFEQALPHLSDTQRAWLKQALVQVYGDHPQVALL